MYRWLQQQSTYVESKNEYDRSYELLLEFLSRKETVDDLGEECIAAVKKLQSQLRTKEFKLANYLRFQIRNSNDASTTSPVESANSWMKSGDVNVDSNMNANNSTTRVVRGINNRLKKRKNEAMREVKKTYKASCAPTNPFVISKGQGQIDHCYDCRLHMKSAWINADTCLVWDFDAWVEEVSTTNITNLSLLCNVPIFMRIRHVSVTSDFRGNYLKCSCMKWKRRGHPCECIFCVLENTDLPDEKKMDMAMIEVRFWKAFSAYFGDDTPIGRMLVDAQSQGYRGENYGVAISTEVLTSIREIAGEC